MDLGTNILQNLTIALNGTFGSILVMVLILVNYRRKYYTSRFRRNFFFSLFIVYLAIMLACFIYLLLRGSPEGPVLVFMYLFPCGTAALLYACFFIVQSEARIDPLTGLANRFSFNEFTNRLSTGVKRGESWAIVMIDMDHFKVINDTMGHQEGDNALRDMAEIIRKHLQKKDFAARYGGDEFIAAIKMEKNNAGAVEKFTNGIQAAAEQHNARNVRPFKLELSCGYDIYNRDSGQTVEDFMGHIDSLMYKNKQDRRHSGDRRGRAE